MGAQGRTQVDCALGLTQVEGEELLQGHSGVVAVGGEGVVGGGVVRVGFGSKWKEVTRAASI